MWRGSAIGPAERYLGHSLRFTRTDLRGLAILAITEKLYGVEVTLRLRDGLHKATTCSTFAHLPC